MFSLELWRNLLILAGVGQLVLIIGSLAIPRVLGWREQLADLPTLTRQMFWVYAAYIWTTNLSFGLLSALAPDWLLDGSPLGTAVCGFIFVYWGARVVIQFVYFDLSSVPAGVGNRWAKLALDVLFIGLTLGYGAIFVMHLTGTLPKL